MTYKTLGHHACTASAAILLAFAMMTPASAQSGDDAFLDQLFNGYEETVIQGTVQGLGFGNAAPAPAQAVVVPQQPAPTQVAAPAPAPLPVAPAPVRVAPAPIPVAPAPVQVARPQPVAPAPVPVSVTRVQEPVRMPEPVRAPEITFVNTTPVPAPVTTIAPAPALVNATPAPAIVNVTPAPVIATAPVPATVVPTRPAPQPVTTAVRSVPKPPPTVYRAPSRQNQANIRVTFPSDSSALSREAINQLATACRALPRFAPGSKFQVIGHADSQGAAEYNLPLSQRRANEVRRHLIEECGVADDAIIAIGMGEEYADQSRVNSEDRRVEFRLVELSS